MTNSQHDFEVELFNTVQELKEIVERQQQQIANLQTATKNMAARLNRIDKQQRDDFQSMY